MTVHYTPKVANARFIDFIKILIRWRGSVWKLVLPDLCMWLFGYLILSLMYRLMLSESQRKNFEVVVLACNHVINYVPITFILGFYVSFVMARWWFQYSNIGWADNFALAAAGLINGTDEKARLIRRAIVRYMLLYQILVFRNISVRMRKVYPTVQSLVDAGYVTTLEVPFIEDTKFWLPVKWAFYLTRKARNEGRITSDHAISYMYNKLSIFRGAVIKLWLADWVPVPLVYTQVTFTCVRVFFIAALVAQQYVDIKSTKGKTAPIDAYVPFFAIIQFFCFMGWLRVAEVLVNPFGEDDTDFDTHLISRRNLAFAMKAADENISWVPLLKRDAFWNDYYPDMLYTVETANIEQHPNIGSAASKLQNRRESKDVRMVKRVSLTPSISSVYGSEQKILKPVVDTTYQFEMPDIPEDVTYNGMPPRKPPRTNLTDPRLVLDNSDQSNRFTRMASKDSQLAAVNEVDEFAGEFSDNSWSDAYLDEPEIKKNN